MTTPRFKPRLKDWFATGAPWIWLNAGAVSISIIMVVGLLWLIASRGIGHFWPADVLEITLHEEGRQIQLLGEIRDQEQHVSTEFTTDGETASVAGTQQRYLLKTGNRDISGMDFRWIAEDDIEQRRYPRDVIVIERNEWGNLYGRLVSLQQQGHVLAAGASAISQLDSRLERVITLRDQIHDIEKKDIGAVNSALERLRLRQHGLELKGEFTDPQRAEFKAQRVALNEKYERLQQRLNEHYTALGRDSIRVIVSSGQTVEVPLSGIVRFFYPNSMSLSDKLMHYMAKLWEFVSDEPREANTEGGIFPAIFGTIMMVILMTLIVTPFGVIAAIYLREYARQGLLTRMIRISVNNLAGVPSIIYGVFGLGFFVYFLGGNIDRLFFPEALPAPTFGTPGILWASLTLALLTVPVVIVATEEGLSRVPRSIREGSLALGATRAETLWRTVLPMASPSIMTGMILAIARAAGEVAPLMLVGVVKLAPTLPLDGNFPFLHLDRKFMHLGFHIYDVGFQSPNVEAARPLVYATALLLVLVIIALNLTAIAIRNRLREKYHMLEN